MPFNNSRNGFQNEDDFVKELNNKKIKRISIKKGVKNSVHNEPVTEMIHFLIENKMPRDMFAIPIYKKKTQEINLESSFFL